MDREVIRLTPPARKLLALTVEEPNVVATFDEDVMLGLTPPQRRQAELSLQLLLLHLERTGLEARNLPPCLKQT